jgi:hypothetical protein
MYSCNRISCHFSRSQALRSAKVEKTAALDSSDPLVAPLDMTKRSEKLETLKKNVDTIQESFDIARDGRKKFKEHQET